MSLIKRNPTNDLTRWDSTFPAFRGLQSLQTDMNRIFDEFFRGDISVRDPLLMREWTPAVDVIENNDAYILKAELPGMNKEDVKITLENNILTIRGEKKNDTETKEENMHRIERRYGVFERSFTVPGSIIADKIEANYSNGILSLTLPKAEDAKPKMINVRVK